MDVKAKTKVLFIVPVPPPYTGLEIMSRLFLNSRIKEEFNILHICSNLNRHNCSRGIVRLYNLYRFFLLFCKIFISEVLFYPKITYSILSENFTGFMRTSFIALIAKLFNNKVVMHLHGANFRNYYINRGFFMQGYIRFILKKIDCIVVLAGNLKQQFSGIYPPDRIEVVPNGVLPKEQDFSENRFKKNSSENIDILFLGLLSQAKGFHEALKAIPLMLEREKNVRFIFAGERIRVERNILFDYEGKRIKVENIDGLILELTHKYSQQIIFSGIVEDKSKDELFKKSDIFILPSYSEGLPVSIIEAMSYGLPVVTTAVGALPDYLKEGENCFFIQPGDYQKLSEKLICLIRDSLLRQEMGRNNYRDIKNKFDIKDSAERLTEVLHKLE